MLIYLFEHSRPVSWIVIVVASAWGGFIRYLINRKTTRKVLNSKEMVCQVVISSLTGFLGGILSFENGASCYLAIFLSGVFGAMGSVALDYLSERFSVLQKKSK